LEQTPVLKHFLSVTTLAAFAGLTLAGAAQARDQIRIVGSSTVFPFSTTVAEQFGKTSSFKTPVVESTGSGGGIKLFCAGVGTDHPDIANASRRIKKSEVEMCNANGVTVVEIKFGFDGIVLANAKGGPAFSITRAQVFLALAAQVPGKDGKLIANPYKTWSDIDKSLPNEPIEVLGPPPTSGTRDAFVELVMEPGGEGLPAIQALDKDARKVALQSLREDGAFIEAGENDNLIVQKLEANPKAVGIFGFSFMDQNADKVQGAIVDGKPPTFENIASGAYPVSRSLYFYVKKQHVGTIPGMAEYIAEFTSNRAAGEEGYLIDKGLIPLPKADLEASRKAGVELTPVSL
jgi:phosphate transport system substrate-binding protein